jgi:hypothetical protein
MPLFNQLGGEMKNRIALLLVVSVILVMALSACGAVKDVATVNDLGKSFMTAMRDGDAAGSWDMLTEDIHTEIGDLATWEEYVAPRNYSDWSFSNTEVQSDVAQMDGEATLGEDTYTVLLGFTKENDAWLISTIGINIKE